MPTKRIESNVTLGPDVSRALRDGIPVVALESTVITHGLPAPFNLEIARDMEAEVRRFGAVPATIAVMDGEIRAGLETAELTELASSEGAIKIGTRELAHAAVHGMTGGTTVAATMQIAHRAGIRVFATGGIGGVHREGPFDVSADLHALARIPMIVVCAGAKAILDIPATLETLETLEVPVVGFGTSEFPAFFSRESGLQLGMRADGPDDVARLARSHWGLGHSSAILLANPIPQQNEIPRAELEPLIEQASSEAVREGIHGPALTPHLLRRVNELSGGRSLGANRALLLNNASVAAAIARCMSTSHVRHV